MRNIRKFFTSIRQWLFAARIEREIYRKIFRQVNHEANYRYPFESTEALEKQSLFAELDAKLNVELIEKRAARMPKAYGDAFRYIAYHDLNERMKMYLEMAAEQMQPETFDPRSVARLAT